MSLPETERKHTQPFLGSLDPAGKLGPALSGVFIQDHLSRKMFGPHSEGSGEILGSVVPKGSKNRRRFQKSSQRETHRTTVRSDLGIRCRLMYKARRQGRPCFSVCTQICGSCCSIVLQN